MQNGKSLFLLLAFTAIVACAPHQAWTDTKAEIPSSPPPVLRLEEFDVGDVTIQIKWIDYQKCEARVLYSYDKREFKEAKPVRLYVSKEKETDKKGSELIRCGSLYGDQPCEVCRFFTMGSPVYMVVQIGYRTYYVCISGS